MNFTEKQLDTLRHMLGINTPDDRVPKPYRNYAAVNPGDAEFVELERLGVVEQYTVKIKTEYDLYQCTDAGKLAAIRSHKTIRRTAPQRRYAAFLDLTDCVPDLTFKEFLTNPEFADTRRNA